MDVDTIDDVVSVDGAVVVVVNEVVVVGDTDDVPKRDKICGTGFFIELVPVEIASDELESIAHY